MSIGIIGQGSFGSFLTRKMSGLMDVMVYDHAKDDMEFSASLKDTAACDFVVLAVPVDAYSGLVGSMKDYLTPESVIVDIASVKSEPVKLLNDLLPETRKVFTHPLFGPESAESSMVGQTIVMCPDVSDAAAYSQIKEMAKLLGLKVVDKTPLEHDQQMAFAQGLTFFVARALMQMGIHDIELHTPSFKKLLDLAELERHHSEELFRTIQLSNPEVGPIRDSFVEKVDQLRNNLLK